MKSREQKCCEVNTPLILSVDDDTTLAPDCLERLVRHMVGDIVVATTRVYPNGFDTWIEKARSKVYDRWMKTNFLIINGCAFLVKTDFAKQHPLPGKTMVEDEELTREINGSQSTWVLVKSAAAYTREPESTLALLKQLTRWKFGHWQLESRSTQKLRLVVGAFAVLLTMPALLNPSSWVLLVFFVLALFLEMVMVYFGKTGPTLDVLRFSVVEAAAEWIAALHAIFNIEPTWLKWTPIPRPT